MPGVDGSDRRTIGDIADTTLPLKAIVKVSIHEPGGRTTEKTVEIPILTHDVVIGIRPDFDDGSVAESAKAGFEAVAVDGAGKRVAALRPHLHLGARRHDVSVVSGHRQLEV